jgi:site-specific DNA recombinase
MKAALYARFSTDRQRDASIEDQFRECERAAKAAGLDVVARFDDKGISGGTATRPGYQALLTAARNHAFDVIVTEDVSRLWRNRAEFGPRSAELEDLGVHCLTCVGDDTRRDGWGLVIQIKQAVAEHARREASYRTRRGLEGNAIAGKPTGGRAYGYIAARDSQTGLIEINQAEAATVRRIFAMYADGMSPRAIASQLNSERVPSPGAAWKRTERRHDGKWLASAIHGEVARGTGLLNNQRYIGSVVWGRSEWKRLAADSARRRHKLLAKASSERTDERLRIVPDELWQRVKARQANRTKQVGVRVKSGLRRHVRPVKYLLSGLLRCSACESTFVLSNGSRYQCATHVNGDACDVTLSLPRERAERIILNCVETDLFDPARLAEFEARYQTAASVVVDNGPRIGKLKREIDHMIKAIAGGLNSSALATELQAAEAELSTLQVIVPAKISARRAAAESPEKRRARMLDRLRQGGEIARGVLQEVFPDSIWLQPSASGAFFWALFADGVGQALFDWPDRLERFPIMEKSACMVAGVGFEPTTFGL